MLGTKFVAHPIVTKCLGAVVLMSLAGCLARHETSYENDVSRLAPILWDVVETQVEVPRSLSVSEENLFAPDADIVWQEEAFGDRHKQVQAIFAEAALQGTRGLEGRNPVKVEIVVNRFHTLSRRARYGLSVSGVHNINFTITVSDKHGMILAGPSQVQADLAAFTGEEALAQEARGGSQRQRIRQHLSSVIAGWLQYGKDTRKSFVRLGM